MSRIDDQDLDELRLARRQKRKRAELTAYIILITICVVIFVAAGVFIHYIGARITQKKTVEKQQEAAELQTAQEESAVIETPEESKEAVEYSEEDILREIIEGVLAEETIEDKVAGLFIITPEQLTGVETAVKAGSGTQEALAQYAVGGITYFPKNIKSTEQISEMLDTTSSMSKYPLFTVLSDQAGTSDAVRQMLGLDPETAISDEKTALEAADSFGAELYKNGFNLCIPPSMEPVEGDSQEEGEDGQADSGDIEGMALGFSRGLAESGVSSCPYVFPIGADTLSGPSSNEISRDELVVGRYELFKKLIDEGTCAAVMVSNVSFPSVTGGDTPASLSDIMITDELRGTLGFDGVVITSPLNEKAITDSYTPAEAAEAAIKAGADMLYIPDDFAAAYEGILESVSAGHITEDRIDESLRRIYRIKYANSADKITGVN